MAVKHDGVGNHVGSYNSPTMFRGGDGFETSGIAPRLPGFPTGETAPAWPSRNRLSQEGLGISSGIMGHELPNLPKHLKPPEIRTPLGMRSTGHSLH